MKISIMQPYFFPYIGYFQMIKIVDIFVFYDDVHYINRGWINPNRIITNNKELLFTLPLKEASQNKLIKGIESDNLLQWKTKFFKTIQLSYSKVPYFEEVYRLIKNCLDTCNRNISAIAMNNGTIPLQIALKLLGGGGEIITTPFSYVATTSTIVWEGGTPVFVDIDPVYWTIDETKIEEAITEKTTCILATHVFGNPCNVDEIERIAKKYNLYVIYDAAHCFGVRYKGKSIFDWGDISTCSFHATKIFHTGEGGAAFVNNEELYEKVFYSHNFGHNGPTDFHGVGINGKMSELQAAMGLAVLKHIDEITNKRKDNYENYSDGLKGLKMITLREGTQWNFSYTQIVFESEEELLLLKEKLSQSDITTRRYFYPSLNKLIYLSLHSKFEHSENLASKILTLPNFYTLRDTEIGYIVSQINQVL